MSSCCSVPSHNQTQRVPCPECGHKGRSVELITLKSLLRPEALALLEPSALYRFCPAAGCVVVYYAAEPDGRYVAEDLKVRVGLKVEGAPRPVCYCFGHTRESVQEEVRATGCSTAVETISAHIRAGRCGCEVNNPSGTCCLGEVRQAAKEALAQTG